MDDARVARMMDSAEKLAAFRAELAAQGLQGFIVPRADEHLGEYVPASAERLAWLTGFTGSAGLAAVLPEVAALFTDGRYLLQLAARPTGFVGAPSHHRRTAARVAGSARSTRRSHRLRPAARQRGRPYPLRRSRADHDPGRAQSGGRNLGRATSAACAPAMPHPLEFAGKSAAEKRAEIAELCAREAGRGGADRPGLDRVASEHPRRGRPIHAFRARLRLVHADGRAELFMEPVKVPEETRRSLGNEVSLRSREEFPRRCGVSGRNGARGPAPAPRCGSRRCCGRRGRSGARPRPVPVAQGLQEPGRAAGCAQRPCARCGGGVPLSFLSVRSWSARKRDRDVGRSPAARVATRGEGFRGESFPAISGAAEHGAIIHYRVTGESDRPIRADELYLIDSGAQYPDGTTDVTRTVWTGPSETAGGTAVPLHSAF